MNIYAYLFGNDNLKVNFTTYGFFFFLNTTWEEKKRLIVPTILIMSYINLIFYVGKYVI